MFRQRGFHIGLLALVGMLELSPTVPLVGEELKGVVVESVGGWSLEDADIKSGDVLLTWRRLPNPPSNPKAAEGELNSYFDWLELQTEQAPRGIVVLIGLRKGKSISFTVNAGLWEASVRPVMPLTTEAVYLEGTSQLEAGDAESAVRTWESILRSAITSGELRAWIGLRRGEVQGSNNNWEGALASFGRAMENAKGIPEARAAAWLAIGGAHEKRNEFEKAMDALTSAYDARVQYRLEGLGVADSLDGLGKLARARGKLDLAYEYHTRSLEMRRLLAPKSLAEAASLNNLGQVVWARGESDRAHEYHTQALEIKKLLAPRSLTLSRSLTSLGALAWNRARLELAQEYFLQAYQICKQVDPQGLDAASNLNNLGILAQIRGELDRAHDYYDRALQIKRRLAPGSLGLSNSLTNMGALAHDRGELGRAEGYHLQALQIRKRTAPDGLKVANSLSNLGHVAWVRGEYGIAYDYQWEALGIQERLAPDSLDVANSLDHLGATSQGLEEWQQAHDNHLRALRIRERLTPGSLAVATSFNNLGVIAEERGEMKRAREYHLKALEIRERLAPRSAHVAASLKYLGDLARDLGEPRRANEYYLFALDALERQISSLGGSYNVQAGFRARHRIYYDDAIALKVGENHMLEAFHVLERFRAQTFLIMLAERDIAFNTDIPDELDEERRQLSVRYDGKLRQLARHNIQGDLNDVEELRRELEEFQRKAGDLEGRIRLASPQLAALQYPSPLGVHGVQEVLDQGTLLLSYSVGEDRTVLFVLSRTTDLQVQILPWGRGSLRAQIDRLRASIGGASANSSLRRRRKRQFRSTSMELYSSLFEPVADQIEVSERLLIIPDGPLHVLPFAALLRGDSKSEKGGGYLVEWKPIHVALSGTVFGELRKGRIRDHSSSRLDDASVPYLAAFGDPTYPASLSRYADVSTDRGSALSVESDSRSGMQGDVIVRSAAERGIFDWQPLPYSRYEVQGIADLFPEEVVRTYLDSQALEESIKNLDPRISILHLAAHAHGDERFPSSSFVAVTIPEEVVVGDNDKQQDNGLLQVWEIFERVRINANLVVLSACDSGLGKEVGGEGLIGLTRAFQYAGARSVAASLWSVADKSTAKLMISFYRHLRSGLPKDEALRAAQLEFIRGPIEVIGEDGQPIEMDVSAPYYWAAFQIFGDWQ